MTREDYVSFEVAKLLKEKGYNELSYSAYDKDGNIGESMNGVKYNEKYDCCFSRPTLYEAQKWLRKKRLVVEVGYMYGDYYIYDILKIPTHDLIGLNDRKPIGYGSYEEALNDGIKEALKLI